ncbi:hypothetical protein I4F81_003701 [Pyropia yezoensis]|uniref:Uncharacterized protein n=1 Tax=Pyropia yezoensis TaxID=2788 RepID=A0ACC3BUC4_PYRYE|nr:hypothetical protein I4F81_003701 [Neopyropia yezoensis]
MTPRRNKKNGGDACSMGGARLTAAESAGACGTGRRRRRRRRPPRRWWATMTLLARTWAPPIGRSLRAANSRTSSAPTRQLKRTSCPTAQADAEHAKNKKNNTSFLSLMSPSRRGGRRERHTRRPRCDNSHRPPAAARCQLPAAPSPLQVACRALPTASRPPRRRAPRRPPRRLSWRAAHQTRRGAGMADDGGSTAGSRAAPDTGQPRRRSQVLEHSCQRALKGERASIGAPPAAAVVAAAASAGAAAAAAAATVATTRD